METRRASLGSAAAPSRREHFKELCLRGSRHTSSSRTVSAAGRGSDGERARRPAVHLGGVKLLRSFASVRFPADSAGYILRLVLLHAAQGRWPRQCFLLLYHQPWSFLSAYFCPLLIRAWSPLVTSPPANPTLLLSPIRPWSSWLWDCFCYSYMSTRPWSLFTKADTKSVNSKRSSFHDAVLIDLEMNCLYLHDLLKPTKVPETVTCSKNRADIVG